MKTLNYLFTKNQAIVDGFRDKQFVDVENFSDWLRNQLKNQGISNAELARRVGVSPTHIGNLVRNHSPNKKSGEAGASVELIDKIAKALGAPIAEARLAAGFAPPIGTVEYAGLLETELEFLNERMMSSGVDRIEDPEEQKRIFHDLAIIAEMRVKGILEAQERRKRKAKAEN